LNSRTPCEVSGFQDRHVRPLRHPSVRRSLLNINSFRKLQIKRLFHRLRLGCFPMLGPLLLRVIELMNMVSMITLEEVRVYIQRDANTTVSELLLDIFGVGLSLNQETGEGVPEVMEPNLA
jgi:hypothetical protein